MRVVASSDHLRDHRRRDERPRRVVDKDDLGRIRRERLKAVAHRLLPRRAALNRRQQSGQAANGVFVEVAVVPVR